MNREKYIQTFGLLVSHKRKELLSLNQEQFAALVGCSRVTLANIEIGKTMPSLWLGVKIMDYLEIGLLDVKSELAKKLYDNNKRWRELKKQRDEINKKMSAMKV